MERGFEQLIVIAAIIIAGVFDLLVRWLKSRQEKNAPVDASQHDETVLVEDKTGFEEEEGYFDLPADAERRSDVELSGEEKVERALSREKQIERALSREKQIERALSKEKQIEGALSREDLVERAQFEEGLVARRIPMPPPPVPAVSRRTPPPASRPRRVSRRVLSPLDARRGIIMMTILGPCRGLERSPDERPHL